MNRRNFLQTTAGFGLGLTLCSNLFVSRAEATTGAGRIPYAAKFADRHWMWGHDSGQYDGPNGVYNIPLSPKITMAEAIRYMNIPNVCVIRPGHPDAEYRSQFRDVKRIAWTIAMGSHDSYVSQKNYVFSLFNEMPNLTGVYLDDFFRGGEDLMVQTEAGEIATCPALLTYDEIRALHEELKPQADRPNAVDLAIVLYSHQLRPSIVPMLNQAEVTSFWTWTGKDVMKLRENFRTFREMNPTKRTLLGLYMWDFGGRQPIDLEFMKYQLDFALELFRKGEIEGTIFHCTPLCNKGLEAVEYSKKWIEETKDETPNQKI